VQFLTFNLLDAVPPDVYRGILQQCDARLAEIERQRGSTTHAERRAIELERARAVQRALDCAYGECLLRDRRAAQVVHDAIQYLDGWKYDLVCWCVMPNHVHLVYTSDTDDEPSIVKSLKGHTGREINRLLERDGRVWATGYFDHMVRDSRELQRVVRYIASNPQCAGLGDWPFIGMRPEKIAAML
jgi:REP element-mobilizing transposase RayT